MRDSRKEERKRERKERTLMRKKEKKKERPPEEVRRNRETTSVMFIEHTPHGRLGKMFQDRKDRLGEVTGRRIKIEERTGSQLRQLLPNTNTWAGAKCPRDDCHTCNQGGEQKRKENCFKRNVLYEAVCGLCEDKKTEEGKRKNLRWNEKLPGRHIYVGETARSIFERSAEHIKAGLKKDEDTFIAKHWSDCHPGERQMPEFRFRIV